MQQKKFTAQARPFWSGFFSVILLFGFCAPLWAQDEAVVATSHPLATRAGMEMLRQGGNAVDAAAAIQFALNVVEPQSSGIGGGAFIMVYLAKTGEIVFLDARETAPHRAHPQQLVGQSFEDNSTHGVSVGVPGTLAGFDYALKKWGRLNLAQTLQPAIQLANDGFAVGRYMASSLTNKRATNSAELQRQFFNAQGQPLAPGALLRQPQLAHTFQLIAQLGPSVFYQGEIAQAMVRASRDHWGTSPVGGPMELSDLAHYQPVERKPVTGHHGPYTLYSAPAPSAGGMGVLQALAMLEPFALGDIPHRRAGDAESVQLTIEALRLWLADRAHWVGDPAATQVPQQQLLSPQHILENSRRLKAGVRMDDPALKNQREGDNTTQFTVVDHEGNVVSVTSTVESLWGSGIMVPGYGFLLNNELTDFNQIPQQPVDGRGANDLRPGLRPRSSMAPTLVFEGNQWRMAFGSPGGITIISTVLEFAQDMLDFHLGPQQAMAQKRFAVLDSAGSLLVEKDFPAPTLQALETLGYSIQFSNVPIGSVQWVGEDAITHERSGAADSRRDGTVLVAP